MTDGSETAKARETANISKDHHTDAYVIACNGVEITPCNYAPGEHYEPMQFRRHDRRACKQENCNRKYLLGGKVVAVNRHKAFEQKTLSLEEYVEAGGRTDNLSVVHAKPTYQRMDRPMPGCVVITGGKRKVMKASRGLHNGKPDYYEFTDGTKATPKKCKVIKHNEGIVFVSKTVL